MSEFGSYQPDSGHRRERHVSETEAGGFAFGRPDGERVALSHTPTIIRCPVCQVQLRFVQGHRGPVSVCGCPGHTGG